VTPETEFVRAIVDEELGNSAYLVGSHDTHTALLIDPLRDVDRYRHAAESLSVRITHVLETHLHADFISGARELAAQIGAEIGASAGAELGFEHRPLAEGDRLALGAAALQVLATPGHSPEHIAFLLTDADGHLRPRALFSGGALTVGGAARTDLLGHDVCTPLARQLFHTLHDKLLKLPDSVSVYPTHGAGSYCVAHNSERRTTTIGLERQSNPLALARDEDQFVTAALSGLSTYPTYYKYMRPINQRGPNVLGGVPVLKPLAAADVQAAINAGALVLDVRAVDAFASGHMPSAYGIALDAPLVAWAGWLIPFNAPMVLVAEDAAQREAAVRQLIRIGYDELLGFLDGGIDTWARAGQPIETVPQISPAELRDRLKAGGLTVVDVRQDSEWAAGHIPGALHIENGRLPHTQWPLPTGQPAALHCQVGPRSMAGVSVLRRRGYQNLMQVRGGFEAWEQAGFEVERDADGGRSKHA
jgi:hydroxyacylglutathione hydrolase